MEIYETRSELGKTHNWLLSLILLLLIIFGTLAILSNLTIFLIPPLFGIPMEDLIYIFGGNYGHPNARLALLFVQGVGTAGAFIVGSLIYLRFIDRASLRWPRQWANTTFNQSALIIPILLSFIAVNSLAIYWNMNMAFPEFLKAFEQYAQAQEAEMMRLTQYITDFAHVGEFLAGVMVIGVMAGIGEELLFRGILQPKIHQYTGNAHLGIWISAFIFSAIHFQFYGFFPRMFLGALFGYLYLYSGSLIYPIVAHILNNVFTVSLVYFSKIGWMDYNIEEIELLEWHVVIIALVVFVICFKVFKDQGQKHPDNGQMASNN